MKKPRRPALGVVILAAGSSTRMGRPKLLLPWGGTSILGHLISSWGKTVAQQIAVVCATHDGALWAELDRLVFPKKNRISNPQPEQGMFSSIRCAAEWAGWRAGLTHWAIALGDQPHLRLDTLTALIEQTAVHWDRICQPRWRGRLRHPVVLPERVFRLLTNSRLPTFRDFLRSLLEQIVGCEVDDPGLEIDIDEPGDYQKAVLLAAR